MSTRSSTLFSTSLLLLKRAALAVVAVKTAWERRRMVGRLGTLDDHMLRDIGITRQDILSVLAEPVFRDPSHRLAERADEARQARRELAVEARAIERATPAGVRYVDHGRRAA